MRVGGTSVGAINALLFALGYTYKEQLRILKETDLRKFRDENFGVVRDMKRLITEFGWFKGDFFYNWVAHLIGEKLGNPNATFEDLKLAGGPDLYIIGTNLSTKFAEVFSIEHTPKQRIADAVRISMSIPLIFRSIRSPRGDIYIDGGLLDNYPIKLFDRLKYITEKDRPVAARTTDYYDRQNHIFLTKHPQASPYVYNRQTLGFRLDSKEQIAMFRDGREPQRNNINNFLDYATALIATMLEIQSNQHLHTDDWQRTIYIDTLGINAINFDITDAQKDQLARSGREYTQAYFKWFESSTVAPANRIVP